MSQTTSEPAPPTLNYLSKSGTTLQTQTHPPTPSRPSSPAILPNTDYREKAPDQADFSQTEAEKSKIDASSLKENRDCPAEDSTTNKQTIPVISHPPETSTNFAISSHTTRISESSKKTQERPRQAREPYDETLGDPSSKRGSYGEAFPRR